MKNLNIGYDAVIIMLCCVPYFCAAALCAFRCIKSVWQTFMSAPAVCPASFAIFCMLVLAAFLFV